LIHYGGGVGVPKGEVGEEKTAKAWGTMIRNLEGEGVFQAEGAPSQRKNK